MNPAPPTNLLIIGHGQACAGIIAATHNNIGIAGISPCSDIIPVNIFSDWFIGNDWQGNPVVRFREDPFNIRDAIDFAWDPYRGNADVISNSWGYLTSNSNDIPNADEIIFAINRARTQGRLRNGVQLGCIVVFASGNSNQSFSGVTFPANVNGVITVGAINNRGNIWNYSSRGSELDLVAPSGNVNLLGDIRTTDRMAANGYEVGNYTDRFGGTSAACPQVSGVAALMLSVNHNLTEFQVRTILQQSATDMGGAGFDNTYGYGRLNAQAALEMVRNTLPIYGPSTVCNSNAVFTLNNLPEDVDTIIWSKSSNLSYISGQGTDSLTVQAASSFLNGSGWVKATITNSCGSIELNKTVWVGKPNTPFAISGFPYNGYVFGSDTEYEFRALSSPGMGLNYYNWVIGCGSIVHGQGTDDIIVRTCTAPDYVTMNFDVSIRVGNECGLSDWLWRTGYVVGESGATYMVYPNPASSEITVALNEKYAEANPEKTHELSINQVRIMDQMGKSLMIKNFYGQELSVRINISALPKGYYIVKINDGESHTILKD